MVTKTQNTAWFSCNGRRLHDMRRRKIRDKNASARATFPMRSKAHMRLCIYAHFAAQSTELQKNLHFYARSSRMRRRLHSFGLISFKNQAICAAARPKTRKLKTQTPLKRAKTQNTKHRLRPRGPKHVKHKTQNTVKTQVGAERTIRRRPSIDVT